tara:strand:+ start:410 stop:559 length:150 start_codon:yes stop_codon:yes gene_type:complete
MIAPKIGMVINTQTIIGTVHNIYNHIFCDQQGKHENKGLPGHPGSIFCY